MNFTELEKFVLSLSLADRIKVVTAVLLTGAITVEQAVGWIQASIAKS